MEVFSDITSDDLLTSVISFIANSYEENPKRFLEVFDICLELGNISEIFIHVLRDKYMYTLGRHTPQFVIVWNDVDNIWQKVNTDMLLDMFGSDVLDTIIKIVGKCEYTSTLGYVKILDNMREMWQREISYMAVVLVDVMKC